MLLPVPDPSRSVDGMGLLASPPICDAMTEPLGVECMREAGTWQGQEMVCGMPFFFMR